MPSSANDVHMAFTFMKEKGARIIVVFLNHSSEYATVKLASDKVGIITQCILWSKVGDHSPKGYASNISLKINAKLGGLNHVLDSRFRSESGESQFQDPPNSLMWAFNKPCMLVGVDVSHPEPGSTKESIAAVVGSMNRSANQYAACFLTQASREEEVRDLTTLMVELFEAFKKNNAGEMPAHVIVYRDGVSTGQFDAVRYHEVPAVKEAVELLGYPSDAVKITYIICSKGHKCRFAYRSSSGGDLINGCPGLCINEQSGLTSTVWNEFYIQHHAAIQGTAKSTRYSLLYDEIGLTSEQLEVMTHWICHLYSRCNMAVSKATPAAYAHLAALRARKLLSAGATPQELRDISRSWSLRDDPTLPSSMNFI